MLHENPYTGRQALDEPSIAVWESGNEFSGAPAAWTAGLVEKMKGVDPNHLWMDGNNGVIASSLLSPSVDVYSTHYYPANAAALLADAATVAAQGKVFINGEFGWTGVNVNASAFLDDVVRDTNVTGSLFWCVEVTSP